MSDIEFNTKGLDQILKALKATPPEVKVGILGDKNARKTGVETNASIGIKHEFGDPTQGLPQRSFLRVPITDLLGKKLTDNDLNSEDTIKEVIKSGTVVPWMKKIAAIATTIVTEGFTNGGYGKWAPNAPGYTNLTGDILVDTTQLRDSISYEVKT